MGQLLHPYQGAHANINVVRVLKASGSQVGPKEGPSDLHVSQGGKAGIRGRLGVTRALTDTLVVE